MPFLSSLGGGSSRGFGRNTSRGSLYPFTDATFTPGGQTGRTGPALATARSGLTGTGTDTWKNNTEFFNTTDGIQLWTVPQSGTYRIDVRGAMGGFNGSYSSLPGYGARVVSDHVLTQGEIIRILVGQVGVSVSNTCQAGSGGGGSFVVRTPYNTNASILAIAGGGGGVGTSGSRAGTGGVTGINATSGGGGGTSGGTDGAGGAQPSPTPCSLQYVSGSGGGFFTSGGGPAGNPGGTNTGGGFSFIEGGLGGDRTRGTNGSGFVDGGFGGGGMGNYGAGGGGGYSGGGGGQGTSCACAAWNGGGGGGSFISGTNQQSISANINNLPGLVQITLL